MLAAEIRIDLGLKALTVCLANIFLSAAADDNFNFGLEASIFNDVVNTVTHVSSNREELVLLLDVLIFVINVNFSWLPRATSM